MSTSCLSSATETRYETFTTSSLSTTFSESLTTAPPSTSTALTTSCLDDPPTGTEPAGTCTSSTVITSTTTIPGGVQTTSVPVTITIPVTESRPTETLFTTSCTTLPPDVTPPPDDTTIITPPPTTITSETSTTLPNGEVVPTTVIVTHTEPATTVTRTQPPNQTQDNGGGGGGSNTNLPAIIGGAAGGLIGLIIIIVGVWYYFYRKRTDWDAYFEREDDIMGASASGVTPSRDKSRRFDMSDDTETISTEPKPYQYGLVGSGPARSPPTQGVGFLPQGVVGAPGLLQMGVHGRSQSEIPLMGGAGAGYGPGPNLGSPSVGAASRPSTGGSLGQAYGYGVGNGVPGLQNGPPPVAYQYNNLNPNTSLPYDERRRSRPSIGSNVSLGSGGGGSGMAIGLAAMNTSMGPSSVDSHAVSAHHQQQHPTAAGPGPSFSSRPLSSTSTGSPTASPPTIPRQLYVTNHGASSSISSIPQPQSQPQSPDFPDFGSTLFSNHNHGAPGPSRTPAPENVYTSFGNDSNGGVALGAGAAAARPGVLRAQNAAMEKARLRAVNAGAEEVVVHRDGGVMMMGCGGVGGTPGGASGSGSGNASGSASASGQGQSGVAGGSGSGSGSSGSGSGSGSQAQTTPTPAPAPSSSSSSGQPQRRQGTGGSEEAPPPAYTD